MRIAHFLANGRKAVRAAMQRASGWRSQPNSAVRGSTRELHSMNGTRRREIAARLRTILSLDSPGDISAVATRLNVDETSLRMSIDLDSPYPTVDVLAAVAQHHGIDPTYLLTGVYDI